MADSIKVSLAVDGESKFKNAMKQAANSIKDVDTRLKVATEDFKKNGDAEKYAEQRGKIYAEEIRRQSDVVRALEGALRDAAKEYGENSAQALRWEGELNKAKVKLSQMQTALDNNSRGLDETGRAFDAADKEAEGFNETLREAGEIAKNTKFSTAIQAVNTLAGNFERAAASVARYAKSAWGLVADASVWADDLVTQSVQTGISVEDLQRWGIAASLIDTEVDTIIKAYSRLVNPSSEVEQTLTRLGISTTKLVQSGTSTHIGTNGETITNKRYHAEQKNANELFWDTVDALNGVTNATLREEAANAIFGKSYLEMIPLIQAGRQAWEDAGDSANINSEEQVSALASFNDSLNIMNQNIQALKNDIAATLAPAAEAAAEAVSNLTTSLSVWIKSEEGQKAIENITGFLTSVASFVEQNPKTAIEGVVAALLGLNAIKIAPGLVSTLALLRTFGGSKGAKAAVDAAANAASSAAGGAAASAGSGVIKTGFASIAAGAKGALAAASPYLAVGAVSVAGSYILDKIATKRDFGEFNALYDAGGFTKNVENAADSIYNETIAALLAGMDQVDEGEGGDKLISIFHDPKYQQLLRQALPDFDELLEGMDTNENYGMIYQYAADAAIKIKELADKAGPDAMETIKTGIEGEIDVVTGAAEKAGESTALGFAAGIAAQMGAVQASVARMMAIAAPTMAPGGAGVTTNTSTYDNSRTLYIDKLYTANSFDEVQQIVLEMNAHQNAAYGQ